MTFTGLFSGHKLDDAFPVFAAAFRTEFFLKDRQNRPVKLLGLCDAHLVDFESDDREAGARKHFDYAPWTQIREPEIVRLDQHKRSLDLSTGRVGDGTIENTTVRISKLGPPFLNALDRVRLGFRDQ